MSGYIDSRMHAVMRGHIPLPKDKPTNVIGLDFPDMPKEDRRFWLNLLDKVIPRIIARNAARKS